MYPAQLKKTCKKEGIVFRHLNTDIEFCFDSQPKKTYSAHRSGSTKYDLQTDTNTDAYSLNNHEIYQVDTVGLFVSA